ncbi:MAG: apolipoprotein N-acyltransferase [Gallionellaceae bacterium]|nr:MAG: apolipoprotein N-acyltransferase [Gallionellaceae bacterium]
MALALLFWLWGRAASPRVAARLGFFFGLGMFGAGVGWIYIALHDYGYMPMLLAALATLLFVALFALFPALLGYLQARLPSSQWLRAVLLLPALWGAVELLRGYFLTGFPWLALGYSQVPDSPLAGYAPILGVYGVSLLAAISAGLALVFVQRRRGVQGKAAAAVLLALWLGGAALRMVEWTSPEGDPVKVSLLQGNIAQDEKFEEGQLVGTLEAYRRLVQASDARLIVLPETALPLLRNDVPESYTGILRDHARRQGGDVLIGAFEKEQDRYYNSMFSLGTSESQTYHKSHLVPFGEFIPLRPLFGWLVNDVLNIPMSDLSGGGQQQALLHLAGQRIAMNICYEDVFGEEIIRALPQATLLLNTSNDAWYGDTHAAMQHNQIAQMRALETGRMMLRATNTGVTSVIGSDGRIRQMLPQHAEGVLTARVQGYAGSTPYVRWGNAAVLVLIVLMLGVVWRRSK